MFQPLDGFARWTRYALIATIVLDVAAIVSDVLEYDLLGGSFTNAQADANDTRQGAIGVIQIVVLLVTVVLFISWFQRAYANVEPLGGARRFSHGWSIGGWFVPVLNLWRPKQIANDIWRATEQSEHVAPLVQWWWGLWLVSAWVQNFAARAAFKGNDVPSLRDADLTDVVGSVLDIVAAVLAILVVRAITTRQQERAAGAITSAAAGESGASTA